MKYTRFVTVLVVGLFALLPACDDDEPSGLQGPFQLTFQGDATFQGPHGGQAISVAVVRTSDGLVVARQDGTVSATADPAFSFTFAGLLQSGTAYQVHYWIDSNFGGGTAGVCDPRANDHQWSVSVPAPTAAVTVTESHDAAATTDVCPSFSVDLTFSGDATFQGPHGGQDINVAVVRASDGAVLARDGGTVSATADPAFSFSFPGLLVVGTDYEFHYWIDSNFGGGTVGVCDPRAIDHQWSVEFLSVSNDINLTTAHEPALTEDVCPSFSTGLTFTGDASFQGPHGGQDVYVAVVRASDGAVVGRQSGTVSATTDPAFDFSFPGLLVVGVDYEVHYWIDSNFGGGTLGACDPRANDHQWSVSVPAPSAAVVVTESHNPAATVDVCPSFSANLSFGGDASFQGPHGGQDVAVGLVRASDGLVVAIQNGTVSATADPSFSFTFTGLLVVGVSYEVHYWIDSNFGGGSAGVCDAPNIDHQWSVDIGSVDADVDVVEAHNAALITDVCSTFM